MPGDERKRAGTDCLSLESLPEGPLSYIVSLVEDPHRQDLRLVCRKLCSLEATTRKSLVFRVPRPSSYLRSPSSSPRSQERCSFSLRDSLNPSTNISSQDSDSEAESEVAVRRATTGPRLPSEQIPNSEAAGVIIHGRCQLATMPSQAGHAAPQADRTHLPLSSRGTQEDAADVRRGHSDASSSCPLASQSYASDNESCQHMHQEKSTEPLLPGRWVPLDGETSEDESLSLGSGATERTSLEGSRGNSNLTSAASIQLSQPRILHSPFRSESLFRVPSLEDTLRASSTRAETPPSVAASQLLSPTPLRFNLYAEEPEVLDTGTVLPEVELTKLLQKFPHVQCLDICHLHPGAQGTTGPLDRRLLIAVSLLAPNLEELHLRGHSLGWQVDDAGLAAVAKGCPKLRKLVVHHWVVGGSGMAALADAGMLKELEMDFFARDQAQGPRRAVAEVARCRFLASLHLRYCNNEDVAAIAEGCPKLQRLTLLFSLLGPSITTLGQKCSQLQELTLRSCDASPDDDPLTWLAEHCTSLTSLSLHAGHCASEEGLLQLMASCQGLKKLSLEFKPLSMRLSSVAPKLEKVTELTLQWVEADDDDLAAISMHCKQLKVLVVSLRQNVTDVGIRTLLQGCGHSLEVLLLRVRDVSDAVLRVLGSSCPVLQRLTLGLPSISSAGILFMLRETAVKALQLPALRRLRLWDCASLTDEALEHVWMCCAKLEGIGLKGCVNLTSRGLCSLIDKCPRLQHVEVEARFLCEQVQERAKCRGFDLVKASP